MQQNGYVQEVDAYFSPEALVNQYRRVDLYGTTEEEVCVHGTPAFLPDEPCVDVIVYIRRGTPIPEVVDGLLAIGIRAEDDGLE